MDNWFSALAYRELLRTSQSVRIPGQWAMMRSCIISLFFNETGPSASLIGNTFMYHFLNQFGIPSASALSLILSELITFYLVMITVLSLLLAGNGIIYKANSTISILLLIGLIVYCLLTIFMLMAGREKWLQAFETKMAHIRIFKRWQEQINLRQLMGRSKATSYSFLQILRCNRFKLLLAYGCQLLVVLADACTVFVLSAGLGMRILPLYPLLGLVGARVLTLLPLQSLVKENKSQTAKNWSCSTHRIRVAFLATIPLCLDLT